MHFLPNQNLVDEMLGSMGLKSIDDLFADIPEDARVNGLDLPPSMSEMEVASYFDEMMAGNTPMSDGPNFLGAGLYYHHIPATVGALAMQGRFYTAYTPYQPEVSQGNLQAMFEYQTMLATLSGMEVVNTSLYDASTALGEAGLMAYRVTGRKKLLIAASVNPEKVQVLETYGVGVGLEIVRLPYDDATGQVTKATLEAAIDDDTAMVYLENPNFFGIIEEVVPEVKQMLGRALLVVGVYPTSLAVLRPPGEMGADIVIGEASCMGNPVVGGGPGLGMFGCSKKLARKSPGRIVGQTVDSRGQRAWCLTLQTREQHIRREKATSNICTNQALMALHTSIYLATLGPDGLERVATLSMERSQQLGKALAALPGFSRRFSGPTYNEIVFRSEKDPNTIREQLRDSGITGGFPLSAFEGLGDSTLWAATEMTTTAHIDALVGALGGNS